MGRVLSLAVIASFLLATTAFAANDTKSTHPKHHAKGAHSQAHNHVSVPKPNHSGHQSAVNKKQTHANKHGRHV